MLRLFLSRFELNKVKASTLAVLLVIGIVITAIPVAIESVGSPYLMVDDTVIVAPVHNNVTVYRDDWGVPHIYAQDTHDAYYALGYVMAQDRLFEMDLFRRATAGRLAELFGDLMFEDDILMRTLGIYQIALDTWNGLYSGIVIPPEVKKNLEMFSTGVNSYISDLVIPDDVPSEYRAISIVSGISVNDLIPYPWVPSDSVAIAGMMGLMLTDTSGGEIIRGALAMVDSDLANFLMPTGWINMTTIMPPDPPGEGLGGLGPIEAITAPLQRLLGFSGLAGSNNWVIDDLNTTTGNAMLANDPHLDLQTPGINWQVHINIPGYTNVIGCCIPGGPVIYTGHNDYFAFGVTNLGADIVDMYYYVKNETHYFYVDHWEPFDVRNETIYKLDQPETIRVVSTRHGPLINTSLPSPYDKMAFRWGGKESGYGEITGFSLMMNATSLADWKHALSYMSVIIQNFVYAGKDGNIAWCPSGKIPLRPPPPPTGNGTMGAIPSNGSAGQNEWFGWIPHGSSPETLPPPWNATYPDPVSLPCVENPKQGFIATANNQPIDPTYPGYPWPVWIGPACGFDPGYRGQRITELIESLEPISIDDMKVIQADSLCIPARNIVPILNQSMQGDTNATIQNAVALLANWNYTELRDMSEPLIWEVFMRNFTDNTFGDEAWADDLYPFPNTIIPLWNMTQTWDWNPYAIALFDDNTTAPVEDMPQIMNKSLHDALDWIASQLGPPADASFSNWKYGKLHVVDFGHPMGDFLPSLNVPHTGPVGCDGGPYTVDPGGHHHKLIVKKVLYVESGSSYRGIYECKENWNTSLILVPPGESGTVTGSPLSPTFDPHYDDTFQLWLNNQYTTCLFNDTEIQTYPKTVFVRTPMQTKVFEITQFGQTFYITIESNSTDLANPAINWELKTMEFDVTGFNYTTGVCNVTIPKALLDADLGDWTVVVDSTPITPVVTENATHSFLYFTYSHSTPTVKITGTRVMPHPPTPHPDYAPSGMPDFDQKQDLWNGTGVWTWCAPTAAANSLWWMDSRFETGITPPPTISDTFQLLTNYTAGIDDHHPNNTVPFIEHLAYLMDTDGQRTGDGHRGTWTKDIQTGITQYLSWSGVNPQGDVNGDGIVDLTDLFYVKNVMAGVLPFDIRADIHPVTTGWPNQTLANNIVDDEDVKLVELNLGKTGMFYEHTMEKPDFYCVEEEVEWSQDVVLVLGFYNESWERDNSIYEPESGHCVTVAGINSTALKIAISDPDNDAFEAGSTPGSSPVPHSYPHNSSVHNNASLVSHDIYNVTFVSGCPSGTWALQGYVGAPEAYPIAVVEAAVITSPLPPYPLDITNVTVSFCGKLVDSGYKTWTVGITVTVHNTAMAPINCTVNVYYFNRTFAQQIGGSQNVTNLPPCDTTTLTFSWKLEGVPVGVNFTVKANATYTCGRIDEFVNGPMTRRPWGDVNNDGKVSLADVGKLDLIYSLVIEPPYWPLIPDINGDCKVSLADVGKLDLIYSGILTEEDC